MKRYTVSTEVPIVHVIPLIKYTFNVPSVSHLDFTQPEQLQPKNLELQYGWCEGGTRVQELLATANIYGSLGFLWLVTLRPHQWRKVYIDSPIPSFLYSQIELAWESKLFFSGRNVQASIDFAACPPGKVLSLAIINSPRVVFLLERLRQIKMTGHQFLNV